MLYNKCTCTRRKFSPLRCLHYFTVKLPTKKFLQIILAAKWLVWHSSLSPNQQRRPLHSLLSLSFFYAWTAAWAAYRALLHPRASSSTVRHLEFFLIRNYYNIYNNLNLAIKQKKFAHASAIVCTVNNVRCTYTWQKILHLHSTVWQCQQLLAGGSNATDNLFSCSFPNCWW